MGKLKVKTQYGTMTHGEVKGLKFIREVDHRYVRWSDKSFRINPLIFPKLVKHGVQTVVFRYTSAYNVTDYKIPLSEIIGRETTTNEAGDTDILVKMSECVPRHVKTLRVKEVEPSPPPPSPEEPKAEQLSLI